MIASDESSIKIDMGKFYILIPGDRKKKFSKMIKKFKGKIMPDDFQYKSGQSNFLTEKELKKIVNSLKF